MRWLGVLALSFYALHAGYHVYQGQQENLLWLCHVAAGVIGVGLLLGSATCVAVGMLWLVAGVPLWLLDLATGSDFVPTSLLTHVGGLALGFLGLQYLGMPNHVWWKALLAAAVLQQICRWITPAPANVNLAHSVYAGWERWFPSYRVYLLVLLAGFSIAFLAAEYVLRRLAT